MTVLRDALRSLRGHALFATLAVASLSLVLALNTTMFMLVDAQLHPPQPYPDPERLFNVRWRGGDPRSPVSQTEFARVVREALRGTAAVTTVSARFAPVQTPTTSEDQFVALVHPDFFRIVGVRPLAGRLFAAEVRASAPPAEAVVSYGLWQRFFGGRPLGEGLTVVVGSRTFDVVGVMPSGVHIPLGADVWLTPDGFTGDSSMKTYGEFPFARLRPGVTIAQAQAVLDVAMRQLDVAYGSVERPLAATLWDQTVRPGELNDLYGILIVAVAIVFVIACANLATLMLARSTVRAREVALRLALGATRGRIMRTALAEVALLALAGAVIGGVLSMWALQVMRTQGARFNPQFAELPSTPGIRTFAFVVGVAAVAMLLSGLLPAWRAAQTDPSTPLKDGAGSATGRLRRGHQSLVVVQVALATGLLMTAMLLTDSFWRMRSYRFPFDARNLVVTDLQFRPKQMPDDREVERTYQAILDRAEALPGAVAAATRAGEQPDGLLVTGESGMDGTHWTNLNSYYVVSPGYLRTMGIGIRDGRDFSEGDRGGPGVVIVNGDAASLLWPDLASPVGRMIKLGRPESRRPWLEVVGLTRDFGDVALRASDMPPVPAIFVVPSHDLSRTRTILVRGSGDPGALAVLFRRELQSLVPQLFRSPYPWLRPWREKVIMTGALATLFASFAFFALTLSAGGLYAVLAYSVSRRAREFAVRIALGAERRHVVQLVAREAAVLALAGVGIGALAALAGTRVLVDGLYQGRFVEVRALLAAEVILFGVALLASLAPVRRAAAAEPLEAIRAT